MDTWGTDHFPIEIKMETIEQPYKKKTNKISTKKTRWKEYHKAIDKIIDNNEERKKIIETGEEEMVGTERRYHEFIEIIKEAVESITDGKNKSNRTKEKAKQEPRTQQVK